MRCASASARVNRAGRPIEAAGAILTTTESVAKRTDDPIYGDRLRNTWEALATIATREHVDFGVGALDQRLREAEIDAAAMVELVAPRARAPTLMPAYLDLWVQTSPATGGGPGGGSVPAWNRAIITGGLDRVAQRHHRRRLDGRGRRQARGAPGVGTAA